MRKAEAAFSPRASLASRYADQPATFNASLATFLLGMERYAYVGVGVGWGGEGAGACASWLADRPEFHRPRRRDRRAAQRDGGEHDDVLARVRERHDGVDERDDDGAGGGRGRRRRGRRARARVALRARRSGRGAHGHDHDQLHRLGRRDLYRRGVRPVRRRARARELELGFEERCGGFMRWAILTTSGNIADGAAP